MAKALAAAAYISLTLLWPALRSRRRTGSFGIARLDRQQALTALGLIVCAGGILIPTPWPAPSWVKAVGWTAIAAGTIVTCTAQAQMGRSWRFGISKGTSLVTSGWYRYIRNPIYASVQLTLAGMVAVSPSVWSAVLVAAAFVLFGVQARAEERHLRATHGAEYVNWAATVGRFVPGVGRLQT